MKKRPIRQKYWVRVTANYQSAVDSKVLKKCPMLDSVPPQSQPSVVDLFFVKLTPRTEILIILMSTNDSKALQPYPICGGIFLRVVTCCVRWRACTQHVRARTTRLSFARWMPYLPLRPLARLLPPRRLVRTKARAYRCKNTVSTFRK